MTVFKILALNLTFSGLLAAARPNVVFIIADDQGYGDLACHGNPAIRTPNLDQLHSESTTLTDYHVAPTCSPTRAALMTGHWTNRTGVWHTINGRSMLRANEVTLATMLKDGGYQTGHFGKWHLGDNYPYRPEDRGFTEVYRHGGGGVGQTPDHWDNAYFDGSYLHNGKVEPAKGFCTDVFFEQAHRWIKECAEKEQPFFAYISTNAPHGPLHCPQKYLDLYPDLDKGLAAFFGMITNIDANVGKTRALLKELGIAQNTLFIYTSDNGSAYGAKFFNAGMSGQKGSPLEGGHRVPMFIHWPAAGLDKQRECTLNCHAVDVTPTLLDCCEVEKPESVKFDGLSLKTLLDPAIKSEAEPRYLVTDSQRVRDPIKWRQSCVMDQNYRLINGKELFDIDTDPGQKKNLADNQPERVEKMRAFYENWWAELEPTFSQTTGIILGHPDHPVVAMTAHDWIGDQMPPWNQGAIRNGGGAVDAPGELGHWAVDVETAGTYEIVLRRWPAEARHPISAALPPGAGVPGADKAYRARPGKAVAAKQATLRIDGKDLANEAVNPDDTAITFTTELTKGSHQLSPYFQLDQSIVGAYYCTVTKQP